MRFTAPITNQQFPVDCVNHKDAVPVNTADG